MKSPEKKKSPKKDENKNYPSDMIEVVTQPISTEQERTFESYPKLKSKKMKSLIIAEEKSMLENEEVKEKKGKKDEEAKKRKIYEKDGGTGKCNKLKS